MFTYILFLLNITLSQNCNDCYKDESFKHEYFINRVIEFKQEHYLKISIYSKEDNLINISNQYINFDKTINLNKDELYEEVLLPYIDIDLYLKYNLVTNYIPTWGTENFINKDKFGMKIKSLKPIVVNVVFIYRAGRCGYIGSTNLLEVSKWGKEFRINSPKKEVFLQLDLNSQNCNNLISYSVNDNPYIYELDVNLSKNENLQFNYHHTTDLERSSVNIKSKYPINIIQGADRASISNNQNFIQSQATLYCHTLYPNKFLGKEYILTPFDYGNSGKITKKFLYKIVPIFDNTEIYINSINRGVFNKYDYIEEFSEVPIYIKANKKISVTQYSVSTSLPENIDGLWGKTFMIHALPLAQKVKKIDFIASTPIIITSCDSYDVNSDSMYCNIISMKDDIIKLDGTILNGFVNIQGSDFQYKSQYVKAGHHLIESEKGFLATVYGHTRGYKDFYGFNAGGVFNRDDADILINNKSYNEFICGNSSFNLSADAPGEAVEFDWTINDTLKVSGKEVNLDLPNAGTYNIKLKLDNDESQVYEWTTTRLEKIKSDLDSVIYLCNDSLSNLLMNVTGGGTSKSITWFPSENITDPTKFNIEFIKPLKESTKLFYEIIDEHCCSYLDSVDIQITNVYPTITTIQNIFCYGDSTTLSLDKDYDTIIWNTGEITKDIIVKESGVYSATVTEGECINDTNIVINVNPLPTIDIEAPNGTILCDGGSIILEAKVPPNTSIVWNDGTRLAKRTFSKSGTYTLTAEDLKTGCKYTKSIIVSDIENLKAEIQGDPSFCDGESTTLTIQPQGESYLWNTGETTQSIVVNQSGLYSATITTDTDCKIDAEIEVEKLPLPTFQILGERIICNNSTTIYPDNDFTFYEWSNGGSSKSITIDKAGNYDLIVTDENGCKATQNITITVSKPEITLSNRNIDFGELLFGNSKLDVITSDRDIIFLKNSSIFNVNYQNKNINISFNPKDIGQFLDTIIIESIGDCKTLDTIYIKGISKAEILAKVSNSEGYPSDIVNNTVNLELLQNIPLPKDFNYEIDIQINEDAIQIQDATTFNYKNNKLEINIADYLNKTSYDEEVNKINSKIMLAKNLENELNITKFETDNQYLIPLRQNGNIKIYEVCLYEERLIQHYNEAIISNITQTNTRLSTYYAGKYTIEITDISGKTTTKEVTTTSDNEEINFNYKLTNGTYIIKITEPGKTQTRKIVFVE